MSSDRRRRVRVVLIVALPFWTCVTVLNNVNAYLFIKMGQVSEQLVGIHQLLLQHIFMLPLLLIGYLSATEIQARTSDRPTKYGLQILVAMLFALSYRPAQELAFGIDHQPTWRDAFHYWQTAAFSPWPRLVAETIWCLVLYTFGLLLVITSIFFLELRDAQARADDLQKKWLAAHLEALRGQLNPHFLFNSLNTVASLVSSRPYKANKVIVDLSDLLRSMLEERRTEYVSLGDELDYIRKYLSVEQVRFEDRLKAVIEADPAMLEVRIPALILQPVVENAIKHGIAKIRGQGELRITAEYRDGRLSMSVANTSAPYDSDKPPGHAIGLRNVKKRLAAIYEDQYDLAAGDDGSGMWVTRISVPILPPLTLGGINL